jgi:hypothetical protein
MHQPTRGTKLSVNGILKNMVLQNSGFHRYKNFCKNYQKFGHASPQKVGQPCSRLTTFKECQFEGAPNYQTAWGYHMSRANPAQHYTVVSDQFHALAPLQTAPCAHWKGSWADPRVTLNALEKNQITCTCQQLKTLENETYVYMSFLTGIISGTWT